MQTRTQRQMKSSKHNPFAYNVPLAIGHAENPIKERLISILQVIFNKQRQIIMLI